MPILAFPASLWPWLGFFPVNTWWQHSANTGKYSFSSSLVALVRPASPSPLLVDLALPLRFLFLEFLFLLLLLLLFCACFCPLELLPPPRVFCFLD